MHIIDAFSKKFGQINDVKWSRESSSEWESEFKMDGKAYSANFSNEGAWVETESVIEEDEIPQPLKDALSKAFPGYKIKNAEKSETKDGVLFEFKIKGESKEIVMDNSGNIVNMENAED